MGGCGNIVSPHTAVAIHSNNNKITMVEAYTYYIYFLGLDRIAFETVFAGVDCALVRLIFR